MFRRDKLVFEHYDSMRGSRNNKIAQGIARKMSGVICSKSDSRSALKFASVKCAQQSNGSDCGVYVLKFAHILGLGKCCAGAVKAAATVAPADVSGFRAYVRKIIDVAGAERAKKMDGKTK